MEYRITQLTAEIATGHVIFADWGLSHTEGDYTAYRSGRVPVPPPPALTGMVYATVDESTAIEAVKDILGEETIAALEAEMLAEITAWQNPTTISGQPWYVPPAPAPAPEPAPPPAP
jgi:hypothetical protein